jgi:mono/diheme cytochrome c family protein
LLLLSAAALAGCALSAPPPPRGNAPILTPLPAPADAEFELPSRKPSVASGSAIFAEKCVACHGAAGRGDGESAAAIQAQFGAAPADLSADTVARTSTPAEWYATLSDGRLERGMPFYSESLSVDERWDVIAYAWSLGSPDDKLALGETIYAERCVQCHGEGGAGDGPQADRALPDLSSLAAYRDVAPGEWDSALINAHVPSFSGKLSEGERSAVIDYLRSFTYETQAVAEPAPAATTGPEATPAPPQAGNVTIKGSIVNGTAGAAAPANLDGTFYYFPGGFDNDPITQTVRFDANGRFNVSHLAVQANDAVAANVPYGNILYWSEPVELDGSTQTLDLPIRVYEETTATDAIQIDRLHVIIAQESGVIEVVEVYFLSNRGDRAVANTTGEPTLRFTLPAGATAFQGMSATSGVYRQTPEGFGYYDAILPGGDPLQVQVAYQLPLGPEVSLERAPTYPIAAIDLLVQDGDLKPASDQLIDQGPSEFQGGKFQVLSGGPFPANQALSLRLVGSGPAIDAKLIGGIALLLIGAGVVGFGVWRSRKPPAWAQPAAPRASKSTLAERERLLDQIAALDDAFEAGQIAEAEYRKRREALKAKALRLMREE